MEDTIRTGKIIIELGFATDPGRVREINEDSYNVFSPRPGSEEFSEFQAVLGVADGVGGHQGGAVASRYVTCRVDEAFIQGRYREKYGDLDDFGMVLRNTVCEVNRDLFRTSKMDMNLPEAGSTLTLGVIKDSVLHLVHVGDSKCFRIRDRQIEQLTSDHSWVADQVRSGLLSEEEAVKHPLQNIITRAVGHDADLEPQTLAFEVRIDDRYLFCSDGLSNFVPPGKILDVVRREPSPQKACDMLIRMAKMGGDDNITVVLAHVRAAPAGASMKQT